VQEVAGLAGLQAQEHRLQQIRSELSEISISAQAEAGPAIVDPATPSTAADTTAITSLVSVNSFKTCLQEVTSVKTCVQISARDLRSSNESNRTVLQDLGAGLAEAKDSLSQLSRQIHSLKAEIGNSLRDSLLARQEACNAIAFASDIKSPVEKQEARLGSLAAEVHHNRELMSDGIGRCTADVIALQKNVFADVSELREGFTCLEGKLESFRTDAGGAAARQMQKWTDSTASVQELRQSLEQCQGDLQANLQLLREQQRDALRNVESEMLELKRGLATLQTHKSVEHWATDIANVSYAQRQQPLLQVSKSQAASIHLPPATDMPLAWRTVLEDVVRRAQWACEEARQGVDRKTDELGKTLKASWKDIFDEQAKVCATASKQASESLEASRLAVDMAKESESGFSRRVGKIEADMRMHIQSSVDIAERVQNSLRDSTNSFANDLEEVKASASKLGKVAAQLESCESRTQELSSCVWQTQAGLNELSSQVESMRSDMGMLDRYTRTETTALAEALQGCLGRVDEIARSAAEQVAKKAVEVAKRAASTESTVAAEEAARQACSEGMASLDSKLVASIDQKVDRKLLELDKAATDFQEAANGTLQSCLAKGVEELRDLRGMLEAAAAQEARIAVEEKHQELLAFATKLQQVALDEVRQALGTEVSAT